MAGTGDVLVAGTYLDYQGKGIKEESSSMTSGQKWYVAVIIGAIFFILASPIMFTIVNTILTGLGFQSMFCGEMTANIGGLLLNTIIFIVVVRFLL